FVALARAIFAQQISTRIARTLYERFAARFPRNTPTPRRVAKALAGEWDEPILRQVGLSRQKRSYLLDLARHFCLRRFDASRLSQMDDEQVIQTLTQVKGIGRWTAEMHLIFVLNRPDVLPVDDMGLRRAVQKFYNFAERPSADELRILARRWAPYRSIATWYLWRGLATLDGAALMRPRKLVC
ncbi:MAG: hypothetical protein NZM00_10185, partial [Anaerolinea sp.]|nr:hypothetical protein [Anaerolinea sp.]